MHGAGSQRQSQLRPSSPSALGLHAGRI